MKLLIAQFSPVPLTTSLSHVCIFSVPCFPLCLDYVHVVVATSMVSDEMDGACSTNGISKKCVKKFCSENRKRVVYLEDQV